MEQINKAIFSQERSLYNRRNLMLIDCRFAGEEDGESALKEASNIILNKCFMDLRYPLWHVIKSELDEVTMTSNCRAALWYSTDVTITNSLMKGIKAVRECKNVNISKSDIISPEFGWKSINLTINDCNIDSEYAFLESKNLRFNNLVFTGKYSFQYVKNLVIENSTLNTKDAFWHAKNVTVKNSIINGEYLGWYSDNLTFINCKIVGTQPLCYCKNLKLINCQMVNCDLSFEYSSVNANVTTPIDSIKNPKSGRIIVPEVKEIILTEDSVYKSRAKIIVKH